MGERGLGNSPVMKAPETARVFQIRHAPSGVFLCSPEPNLTPEQRAIGGDRLFPLAEAKGGRQLRRLWEGGGFSYSPIFPEEGIFSPAFLFSKRRDLANAFGAGRVKLPLMLRFK